jgi:flavin-dependent dehydrogenase
VTVFDRKHFEVAGPRGCNMCAGVVSDSLCRRLDGLGVSVSPETVQRSIEAYSFEVRGARVRIPKPPGARIYTVFRSGGPYGEDPTATHGFDEFLLRMATERGATHVHRVVRELRLPTRAGEPVVLADSDGDEHCADAVVGAFGVNTRTVDTFRALGFGYEPPPTTIAAQCELPLPEEEIDRGFGNEVKALSLGTSGMRFAALVPKLRHVTVSLIGRDVTHETLEAFIRRPELRHHFPEGWEPPEEHCRCRPRLPLGSARHPVHDRILVIGDAHTSRYLKNGLDSAFLTATLAAQAILAGDLTRAGLERAYVDPCGRAFTRDTRCARFLFAALHCVGKTPRVAAAQVRLAERELERGGPGPLCSILWGMLTGDEPYSVLLGRALSPRVLCHLTRAGLAALARGARTGDGDA